MLYVRGRSLQGGFCRPALYAFESDPDDDDDSICDVGGPLPNGTPGTPPGGCAVSPSGSDNCPSWPNPAQSLPPWPIPANDPDCDGFGSSVENSAGTNPFAHCGTNAWPADINNDGFSDIADIAALTGNFGLSVPPAPARANIAPDPPDGFVDTADIARMTALFGQSCL